MRNEQDEGLCSMSTGGLGLDIVVLSSIRIDVFEDLYSVNMRVLE